jgi:hypothetical protein
MNKSRSISVRLICILILLFTISTSLQIIQPHQTPTTSLSTPTNFQVEETFGEMPLYFIENQGQVDAPVAYYVQGSDKTLYFTPDGVTFVLSKAVEKPNYPEDEVDHSSSSVFRDIGIETPSEMQHWVLKLDFIGANPEVHPLGEERN